MESWPPSSRFLLGSPAATALRSAPAQKYPPVPVNTATDAASSASNARKASYSLRAVAPSTALRQCGRLMETMVIGPSRSIRTVSVSVMVFLPVSRHCEERSDEAIQFFLPAEDWIASSQVLLAMTEFTRLPSTR